MIEDIRTTGPVGSTEWVDTMKGLAISCVVVAHWNEYMGFSAEPGLVNDAIRMFDFGPVLPVFIIISGFGLTFSYLHRRNKWDWKVWGRRRLTKIVIPYEIAVLFSFSAGVLGSKLYESLNVEFSMTALLSYLAFARNHYKPGWGWNNPLWFMPVIVGLYALFPVLVHILNRRGAKALLIVAFIVTYFSLTLAFIAGGARSNGADHIFSFWTLQFAAGMLLAYYQRRGAELRRWLTGYRQIAIGALFIAASWALRTYVPDGRSFNDGLTSCGSFLLMWNIVYCIDSWLPDAGSALRAVSKMSYHIYLIHYPIMKFLIGPALRDPRSPILVMSMGVIYLCLIYLICRVVVTPLMHKISFADFGKRHFARQFFL